MYFYMYFSSVHISKKATALSCLPANDKNLYIIYTYRSTYACFHMQILLYICSTYMGKYV